MDTFCRTSKDQSETVCLITILCFLRISNSRTRKNCTGDSHIYLFLRECTAHHLHYSLPTYFPVAHNTVHSKFFFNVCRIYTCRTRIYCTKALCNSCTTYRHDLPKEPISCSLTFLHRHAVHMVKARCIIIVDLSTSVQCTDF